jgi:hypothetical protein
LTSRGQQSYIDRAEMNMRLKKSAVPAGAMALAAVLLLWSAAAQAPNAPGPTIFKPASGETARPAGLPEIGLWMLAPDFTYAHWLGARFEGKKLREPINVVITDAYARDAGEAVTRLLGFSARAGFRSRGGHSSGYFGWISGRLYPQLPSQRNHCLADEPFEINNNHGRLFGPARWKSGFLFLGAFSREKISPLRRAKHGYVSFARARDAFARGLIEKAGFTFRENIHLGNALLGDPGLSTGDHDGFAVWLAAPERL